jgi:hypothetical protein
MPSSFTHRLCASASRLIDRDEDLAQLARWIANGGPVRLAASRVMARRPMPRRRFSDSHPPRAIAVIGHRMSFTTANMGGGNVS